MQISSQSPLIHDIPAILLAIGEALEKMHAEKRAHGAIEEGALKGWLTDTGDAFDEERFRATAKPEGQLPEEACQADIHSFATYCIGAIAGSSTEAAQTFTASYYEGTSWPVGFLQLLEELSKQSASSSISMADLSKALKESKEPEAKQELTPDPIKDLADDSEPRLAKIAPAAPAVRFALRNATVNKPYSYEPGVIASKIAETLGHSPSNARIFNLKLPEDHGLFFDQQSGAISGTPTRPFEGEVSLDYSSSPNCPILSTKVTLLINPDPASLWKDLLPPADAPYQKPLLDHSEGVLGPYRIVAASRRGRSHANKAEFRDDDYAYGYAAETGWLVVVVADGAGSATYSRRGSQIACDVAKNRLLTVLNSTQHNQAEALYLQHRDWQHPEVVKALRQCLYEAALLAHHKLRAEAAQPSESLPCPATLRNFDTTLLLLAMKKVGDGCLAATFAIGDGGVGLLPNPEEGMPLTKADSGEHAGQTIFLTFDSTVSDTEANLESRFHFVLSEDFAGALAMTDGITDPKFPSDAAFSDPAQWAALWVELQPVLSSSESLLDWMNFFSPGNHDDRTLVAVLPAPPATPDLP